jgi:hypothetical protein
MLKVIFEGEREIRIILHNEHGRMMGDDLFSVHGSGAASQEPRGSDKNSRKSIAGAEGG